MPGKSFWKVPNCTTFTIVPAPMPMVKAGAATRGGMPWLIMIGSAMTPIAIAAPTPYIEENRTAVTSVMVIAETSGRSPASSTAERITLSAMPVWISTCANQAPNTMMMTAPAKVTPPACSTFDWMSLRPMPEIAAQAIARSSSMTIGLCPRMIATTTARNASNSTMPVSIFMCFLPLRVSPPPRPSNAGFEGRRSRKSCGPLRPEMLLAGAAIEHLHLAADDGGVGGERFGGAVRRWTRLVLEIVIAVGAAHQRGAVLGADRLLHVGRDVADGEADAPVVRLVGLRAVRQQNVMQRGLARLQDRVDTLGLVDLHRDLLAAAQEIVLVERVLVLELAKMRARHEFHAAVQEIGRRERHPHRHHVGRTQAPVGRILVPRHEAGIRRFLDEEAGAPTEEIWAEHILDRIEDPGLADQVVQPGEIEMGLVALVAADRSAGRGLMRFELGAQLARLAFAQHVDRKIVAVALVLRDRLFGQKLGHRLTPFLQHLSPHQMVRGTAIQVKAIAQLFQGNTTVRIPSPRRMASKPSLMRRSARRDVISSSSLSFPSRWSRASHGKSRLGRAPP